jgi:hypothetical protein
MAELSIDFIREALEEPGFSDLVDKSKLTDENIRAAIKTLPHCHDAEGNYTCSEIALVMMGHVRTIANSAFIKKAEPSPVIGKNSHKRRRPKNKPKSKSSGGKSSSRKSSGGKSSIRKSSSRKSSGGKSSSRKSSSRKSSSRKSK